MGVVDEFRICFHDLNSEFRVADENIHPNETESSTLPHKTMQVFTLLSWEQVYHASERQALKNGTKAYNLQQLSLLDMTSSVQPLTTCSGFFYFEGQPNPILLEVGLNQMIARRECMRTYYVRENGRFITKVLAIRPQFIMVYDLRFLTPTKQRERTEKIANQLSSRPFEMEKGPLIRTAILITHDNNYLIHMNMHQSISDKWSLDSLMSEWQKHLNDPHSN